MNIQRYVPCDALKAYIDFYWLYTAGDDDAFNQLLPAGYVEVGFKLNDVDIITTADGITYPVADIKILGQLTAPGGTVNCKGAVILVVRFFMHTASLFFNQSMGDFTNRFFDLKDIFHAEKDSLYNRLREQKNIAAQIAVVESFFMKKLERNISKGSLLKPVEFISRLGMENMNLDGDSTFEMQTICSQVGLSNRYLQRLFADFVGISPKTYLKITRFQRSLLLLEAGESYAAIAYKCGYFDQAHFIKEFKTYSGETPAIYRSTRFPDEISLGNVAALLVL